MEPPPSGSLAELQQAEVVLQLAHRDARLLEGLGRDAGPLQLWQIEDLADQPQSEGAS